MSEQVEHAVGDSRVISVNSHVDPNAYPAGGAYQWFCEYHTKEIAQLVPAAGRNPLLKSPASSLSSQQIKFSPGSGSPSGDVGTGTGQQMVTHIEDAIFNIFKGPDDKALIGVFLQRLTSTGVRKTDPRLAELLSKLKSFASQGQYMDPVENLLLTREQFMSINSNIVLINRILRNKVILPDWSEFCDVIKNIYETCKSNTGGKVANYIPQLNRMDPNLWGVSVCTVDGQRLSVGDSDVRFCIQSGAKPLNYALALQELGASSVHLHVGHEPSGRMFNELALDHTKKPHNPMINAGAIVVSSLLKRDMNIADRYDSIFKFYKRAAGGEYVGFNNAVFLSEREASDRNYALAYYLRENHCFPSGADLQETMDIYFMINSMELTCESGSIIAATLANGGICPITDEPLLMSSCVRDVLSLMYSCGMYDNSGQFAFKVGLPAKGSVSGAILLVVPNVMGVCLFSPPLDRHCSVRGLQFCEELVKRFNFHNYDNLKRTQRKLDPRRRRVETKGQQVVNLLFSAANGDTTAMRRYLLQGIDMAMCDYDGRTALHLAASEGHYECVKFLVEKCDVPLFPEDRWGHTPLHDAKRNNYEKVMQYLESKRRIERRTSAPDHPCEETEPVKDNRESQLESGYSSTVMGYSTPRTPPQIGPNAEI